MHNTVFMGLVQAFGKLNMNKTAPKSPAPPSLCRRLVGANKRDHAGCNPTIKNPKMLILPQTQSGQMMVNIGKLTNTTIISNGRPMRQ
jgi:hypothetical protein